jgi:hypothetical protein
MAKGNMILTLVAQTTNWAKGLKKAAGQAVTFGSVVKGVAQAVSTAFLGIAGAVVLFLPNFIKMGEEARKSERRLANIATNMGLFGANTDKVTKRLSKYAETLSFATGVDDELIRANEAVLLTFKNLAKSAETVGGPFDRATQALLDLAAAGKDVTAVKLGRALEDPIKGMTGLTRAGIIFTKQEQAQIKSLTEHNNLLGAQDIILKKIEQQVGGTASATASSTEKMQARFENVLETLSGALLPAVDTLTDKFSKWLDSQEGKKAIDDLTKSFEDFGTWITSPMGQAKIRELGDTFKVLAGFARDSAKFLGDVKDVLDDISKFNASVFKWLDAATYAKMINPPKVGGNTSAPGGAPPRAGIQVNVKGITPSATIGKTVQQALRDAERLGAR